MSRGRVRHHGEMPLDEVKEFFASLSVQTKQYDAAGSKPLPKHEIAEILIGGQKNAVRFRGHSQHDGVRYPPIGFPNAEYVVALLTQPIHQEWLDIFIGQKSHLVFSARKTASSSARYDAA